MIDVSAENIEENSSDDEPITVETEHREELSREAYDRELVKRVAELNDLTPEHVMSRRTVMLDMSELSVEPGDFE
ncbi:hypothetical protein [Halococcus sediminicola]|uniref:hypothetical protein n=1 Tax=Halococcus sediminicola TaxID=1264579 RepID=UPI000678A903|nr:hypothetical protein [Halococcus sediminicola]